MDRQTRYVDLEYDYYYFKHVKRGVDDTGKVESGFFQIHFNIHQFKFPFNIIAARTSLTRDSF